MTRGNDTALVPCVDQRTAMGNALHPNAIVSIRASTGTPDQQGFYVEYSDPPLNAVQAGPSVQFARAVRGQMRASGLSPASTVAQDGLRGMSNVVELNLAQYPAVQVVCGNVKNAEEAASMETAAGRQKYADAIVRGIVAFVISQPR